MKKSFLLVSTFILSAALLTACGEVKVDTGSSTGEVNVDENGSGPDDDRGRLVDDKGDNEVGSGDISGSIVPAVSGNISPVEDAEKEVEVQSTSSSNESKGRELMAIVSSPEEAQEIAKLYGIELLEEQYGVAVYHTDEDPSEVVKRGIDNGWPPIGINHTSQLID